MSGTVVTFYSYKGGVGRSFALANVAAILSGWGYRVLCIDWDIEAPGLGHYFSRWTGESIGGGLIELLDEVGRGNSPDWKDYCSSVALHRQSTPTLQLLPSGRLDDDYVKRVQRINWDQLYERNQLGTILERMRDEWVDEFDFVLIDGRTGITDFSGIFTAQLPDILVFLFTANRQSINGAMEVVRRAQALRSQLPYGRSAFLTLPVPARFEIKDEYSRAQEWKDLFARELESFVRPWLSRELEMARAIDMATIPYFPYWSFGEEIAVLREPAGSAGVRSSGIISFSLETIAALIAHRLGRTDLLHTSRDDYVHAARRGAERSESNSYDVFLSFSQRDLPIAKAISSGLRASGNSVFMVSDLDSEGAWAGGLSQALERSKNLVVMVGDEYTKWQEREVNHFLRLGIDDNLARRILPVAVSDEAYKRAAGNSTLRNFQFITLNDDVESIMPSLKSALDDVL